MNARTTLGLAILGTAILGCAVPALAAARQTHLIVITGVEGDQEHGDQFHKWATAIIDAARRDGTLPEANVVYLADKPDRDPPARIARRSTRENVENAFGELSLRVKPDDEVVVVLFGHGSFDGRQASFNLPGPDLSAAGYAKLLDKLPSQQVVFVNTASSSGAFLAPLGGPGRTIVTATKTGGERNEPRFPAYFVEAFTIDAADRNRDGRVSILEAFEYARTKVAQAYQQAGLIPTEHAGIEDGHDGNLAAMMFLAPDRAAVEAASVTDPELGGLMQERQALESQINALKLRKPRMEAEAYDREMEKLLTDLALKTRAIRRLQEKK